MGRPMLLAYDADKDNTVCFALVGSPFARDDSDGYARGVFSPASSAARVRTGLSSVESPSRPPAAVRRTCSCQLANQRVRMGPPSGKAGRVGGVATAQP